MATTNVGLRERKKQKTRAQLTDAAFRLFGERGFDGTTIEDIVDEVEVSPRTFFRYFDSKEDALLADHSERLALLRETLRARPVDEGPLTAVRAAILEVVGDLEEQREPMLCKMELMQVNPGLRAHSLERMGDLERTLATALAERTGVDPERDLRPRLIAGAVVMAMRVAVEQWGEQDGRGDLRDMVEQALDLLDGGLDHSI